MIPKFKPEGKGINEQQEYFLVEYTEVK